MSTSLKKTLEEMQLKISEYSLAEAKARKEKAEVELETARMQQAYACELMERDRAGRARGMKGGTKS